MDFKIEFSQLLKQLRTQVGFEFMDKKLNGGELCTVYQPARSQSLVQNSHSRQTCGEKMASDVEFQHGREMNMLELLCHLVKRISFLAKLVRLTLQNVESVFDVFIYFV